MKAAAAGKFQVFCLSAATAEKFQFLFYCRRRR
jgi:hypothetical protein